MASATATGSRRYRRLLPLLGLSASLLWGRPASAIDTLEPFEARALDVEIYAGGSGLGTGRSNAEAVSSFLVGYGLSERVSIYGGGSASQADRAACLGAYGTLVDSGRFDLDLFLEYGRTGAGLRTTELAAGLEINLDGERFGLFAIGWEAIRDRPASLGEDGRRVFETVLAGGGYWNVAPDWQLLVQYDSALHHVPEEGQAIHEVGGVGLGCNVMVREAVELVSQVTCDLPQGDESPTFGFSLGIIVTIP